jgi:ATP-dependent helicase STH1/SNF2
MLLGFQYLRLDGSTKSEERSEMVKIWNTPNSPHWLFILSTKAGGLGLNLQTADTVIIFDTDWNPMMDLQAQDRVHRIGQSKTVRVFRLICNNSVEERILERASFKLDVDAKVIQAGMFNTNASDAMRKQMLEQLLHESEENKEESELITNDSQVNALIARDDEEFALYTKMDEEREIAEEREWKARGNRGPRPSRLMTEDELPEWLKVELPDTEEDITVVYGRGMRQRKDVVYDDGLSLNQYAMLVETGQIGENGQPIRKRKVQHTGSSGDEEDIESDNENNQTQEQEAQDDGPKKRGRPRKEPASKRPKEVSSPPSTSELEAKLTAVWDALEQTKTPTGIPLCRPFLKLPSKRDFPEYYRKIKSAISMNQIKQRIPTYRNYLEFKQEFQKLVSNAQTFNKPGSEIYQMSVQLNVSTSKTMEIVLDILSHYSTINHHAKGLWHDD